MTNVAPDRPRILVTGGAGAAAEVCRPALAEGGFDVLLLDIAHPGALRENETAALGSILDDSDLDAAMSERVDLIVHLAGHPSEHTWDELLRVNIDGTQRVLEAARRNGVPRVLLASSIHAVGGHSVGAAKREVELTPYPDTFYGVSKATAEALGRLYGGRFGLTVVSVRIGTIAVRPFEVRQLSTWLSPSDFVRLCHAVLRLNEPGAHVVWGVSANSRRWVSHVAGEAIGYAPLDDAEKFATSLDDEAPGDDDALLGGAFLDDDHPPGAYWNLPRPR